ncbi:MAG: TVP38/TMEM64 family protein [Gemmatimonadota bacterium]
MRGWNWSKLAAGLGAVVLVLLLGRWLGSYLTGFAAWVDGLGAVGPFVFMLGYAIAAAAFVPGSILTLAAGAVFGLAAGTLYAFVGATMGASIAFLAARHVLREPVERRFRRDERFRAIDEAVARQGRGIVFLLRLSPVFPFNALNYALGLTGVRFRDYLLASLGMLPGTLLYVYFGKAIGDVALLDGGLGGIERGPGYYAVLALGLAATLLVTIVITRTARRALHSRTDAGLTRPLSTN